MLLKCSHTPSTTILSPSILSCLCPVVIRYLPHLPLTKLIKKSSTKCTDNYNTNHQKDSVVSLPSAPSTSCWQTLKRFFKKQNKLLRSQSTLLPTWRNLRLKNLNSFPVNVLNTKNLFFKPEKHTSEINLFLLFFVVRKANLCPNIQYFIFNHPMDSESRYLPCRM